MILQKRSQIISKKSFSKVSKNNKEYQHFVHELKKSFAKVFLDDFHSYEEQEQNEENTSPKFEEEKEEKTINVKLRDSIDDYITRILQNSQGKSTNINGSQQFNQKNTDTGNGIMNQSQNFIPQYMNPQQYVPPYEPLPYYPLFNPYVYQQLQRSWNPPIPTPQPSAPNDNSNTYQPPPYYPRDLGYPLYGIHNSGGDSNSGSDGNGGNNSGSGGGNGGNNSGSGRNFQQQQNLPRGSNNNQ